MLWAIKAGGIIQGRTSHYRCAHLIFGVRMHR